jgi:hypothetical protein
MKYKEHFLNSASPGPKSQCQFSGLTKPFAAKLTDFKQEIKLKTKKTYIAQTQKFFMVNVQRDI